MKTKIFILISLVLTFGSYVFGYGFELYISNNCSYCSTVLEYIDQNSIADNFELVIVNIDSNTLAWDKLKKLFKDKGLGQSEVPFLIVYQDLDEKYYLGESVIKSYFDKLLINFDKQWETEIFDDLNATWDMFVTYDNSYNWEWVINTKETLVAWTDWESLTNNSGEEWSQKLINDETKLKEINEIVAKYLQDNLYLNSNIEKDYDYWQQYYTNSYYAQLSWTKLELESKTKALEELKKETEKIKESNPELVKEKNEEDKKLLDNEKIQDDDNIVWLETNTGNVVKSTWAVNILDEIIKEEPEEIKQTYDSFENLEDLYEENVSSFDTQRVEDEKLVNDIMKEKENTNELLESLEYEDIRDVINIWIDDETNSEKAIEISDEEYKEYYDLLLEENDSQEDDVVSTIFGDNETWIKIDIESFDWTWTENEKKDPSNDVKKSNVNKWSNPSDLMRKAVKKVTKNAQEKRLKKEISDKNLIIIVSVSFVMVGLLISLLFLIRKKRVPKN